MKKSKEKHSRDKNLVKDPVCGMVKPKEEMKAKAVFREKTYYFCTETDKQMFIAYPEYWLPKKSPRVRASKENLL